MKKLVVQLVCVAILCGCSAPPPEGDVLCLAFETSPNKLDPALVVDVAEGQICSLVYQGLVRFSPEGRVIPDAARSWNVDDSGTRYVFHLDSNARFSSGERVRASDVASSFERVLSPHSRSPRKWVLDRIVGAAEFADGAADSIAGLSTPDDSTVVIFLEKPFRPFLELLGMPAACIVPSRSVEAEGIAGHRRGTGGEMAAFAERPVGSGRWMLSRWERGDYLDFVPNPHYPGAEPALRRIRFRIIPEAFTRIAEFEAGTLDILRIPHAELDRFLGDESRRALIQSRTELRVVYIGLNNRQGPLSDVRVRRAFNRAVDVERIIEVMTGSHATRAAGVIPPGLPGYVKRSPYVYNPVEARRLLGEAGYKDGFELDIWQRDSPEGNRIVEAVQGYLLELGVRVRIVKREWSAFKEAVSQGRVDAFFLDWYADYPDAENFLYPLFHSENTGGGGNRSFFMNPRVDSLIEASQGSSTASEAEGLYAEIDSLVFEQAPWLYLYFPTAFVIVSPHVQGYTLPTVYLGDDFSTVSKTVEGET